jgi:drug/metabolite transporter (DMT)-like permease
MVRVLPLDPNPMTTPIEAAPAVVPDEDTPPPPPSLTQHRPLLGVLLLAAGTFLFSVHDATNKLLLDEYNVPVIAAVRYTMQTLLLLAILGPTRGPELVRTRRTWLVLARGMGLVLSSLFFGLGLQLMPMPETTAIGYIAPLIVVLLAKPLLNESIGPFGWMAAIVGFTGMLLIVRPGGGLDPLGVTYIVISVAATVAYNMLSRTLAHSERTLALLFYSSLLGAVCFGLAAPFFLNGTVPTGAQIAMFLSLGVSAGIGHFLFTAAFRYAEASLLAPVGYVHLVWATMLGWLVFGHVPDGLTILGMLVVIAAGVLVALRSLRKASRRA